MQLYISIGLVLLIATTVKTLTNPGAFSKPLFTKVTKREDKFCTNGGAHYCFKKIAREGGLFLLYQHHQMKKRMILYATSFVRDSKQLSPAPQEKDIDRDIFIVTNKGFETACSQDVGRSTS
ncbi:hypothetical protein MJO28_014531 [Puccinia striiformis f. sp. tritici]|uniref:Uncharacterized protein n=1 Tax=Puccinia striiformis f. sp. tritici TaxID=168172 RepID=A0ACC0DU08_9BASI|nr:hypothetical protein MJO28_014531 [Puccinia striiformis f. sp. tritici]KAI7939664.1 hypothetical protein MJO29_014400 [Puccinia striiformis f. sp. tritici]